MANIFHRTTIQQIDQRLKQDGFTAVEKYLSKLGRGNTVVSSNNRNFETAINLNEDAYEKELFLRDTGTGPISKGIKSLEAFSRLINGTSYSSLLFFNTEFVFSNVAEIKSATDAELTVIVYTNLGISEYVITAKTRDESVVSEFNTFCLKIGKMVRSGSFHLNVDSREILNQCKKIVKIGTV